MKPNDTYGLEEDFQQLIVATALRDPSFLIQYEDVILPRYFDYSYLSSIVRTAKELAERINEVPSKVTMVEEIKAYCERFNVGSEDREFILSSLDTLYAIEVTDVEYVRTRVVEFGQRQALKVAIMKIAQLFNAKEKKHGDIYDQSVSLLEDALRVGVDTQDLGLSLYPNLDKIPELANSSAMGSTRKVRSGFLTLDEKTGGGPGRGEVWGILGLPGRGKSTFLVNVGAAAVKAGLPVAHITIGDLKDIDVGVRYAARLTMTNQSDVTRGSAEYIRKAKMMMRYDPHLFIKYFPSDTATMGHIRAYLSKLRSVHNVSPAVVIVDYPEELKMPVRNDLYLSGGANYSAMNKMASEFDALFWAASQPRDWTPESPSDILRGSVLSESRKKLQKLDGLCSWNMTEEEELFQRGRLWVDKTRRYKSHYLVWCDTDLDKMLIKEGKAPERTELKVVGSEYSPSDKDRW